jgi:hypothetical protein
MGLLDSEKVGSHVLSVSKWGGETRHHARATRSLLPRPRALELRALSQVRSAHRKGSGQAVRAVLRESWPQLQDVPPRRLRRSGGGAAHIGTVRGAGRAAECDSRGRKAAGLAALRCTRGGSKGPGRALARPGRRAAGRRGDPNEGNACERLVRTAVLAARRRHSALSGFSSSGQLTATCTRSWRRRRR